MELVSASRFPTGLCHYVYDAVLGDGRRVVLRIAKRENVHLLRGAIYWYAQLAPLGVQMPAVFHACLSPRCTPYPYVVLEHLQGNDLGEMYLAMTGTQRHALAYTLASLQKQIGRLPEGEGFGFQSDPETPPPYRTWAEAVEAGISRSEQWIIQAGLVDPRYVERVRIAARLLTRHFRNIRPQAFLGDITTKNVLVYDGRLTGIVDVDEVCFGDRVAHLGLTRMSLLGQDLPTDYIDYWCDALQLNEEQRSALDFYTAEACLCFLGEQGHQFNQERAPSINWAEIEHLQTTLDGLLARLS